MLTHDCFGEEGSRTADGEPWQSQYSDDFFDNSDNLCEDVKDISKDLSPYAITTASTK